MKPKPIQSLTQFLTRHQYTLIGAIIIACIIGLVCLSIR